MGTIAELTNQISYEIIQFIANQSCASVAVMADDGAPYCFSCYYVFNEEDGVIYFKSSSDSNHFGYLKKQKTVGGVILPDKLKTGEVVGIQFRGTILDTSDALAKNASLNYHNKLPYAIAMKGEVHSLLLTEIKMTNSKWGFGKKLLWQRE